MISDYLEAEANPDGDRRQLEGAAAGLKAFGTWHAMDTVQAAREACGGQGYLAENRFGTIRSDIDVFTTYEGDNTVLAQLLAKALLTGYRANFEDMSASRIIRYLSRRVGTVLTESVPMLGAISDVSTAKSQRALLKRREKHSVETLARRIRDRISAGGDPAEAFVAVQPHTLHAARAHVERNVLRAINNARRSATDPELAGPAANRVASLYALSRIEDDAAWFIQHGALTTGGARDVTRAVDHLCAELRPHARHLVDAFGIPDRNAGSADSSLAEHERSRPAPIPIVDFNRLGNQRRRDRLPESPQPGEQPRHHQVDTFRRESDEPPHEAPRLQAMTEDRATHLET